MKTLWIAGAVLFCCAAQAERLNYRCYNQNRLAYSEGKGTLSITESAAGQGTGTEGKLLPVETLAQGVPAFGLDLH